MTTSIETKVQPTYELWSYSYAAHEAQRNYKLEMTSTDLEQLKKVAEKMEQDDRNEGYEFKRPTFIHTQAAVGLYANYHMHTDVKPYEIIELSKSGKTAKIRSMKSEIDPNWKPDIIPGGFAGHCVNNYGQKHIITSDPDGHVRTIRRKKSGDWTYKGSRFVINESPIKFHDYNF